MITPSFSLTATERVLPKLALDFTTASIDSRVTFTRTTGASNPATYVNSSGLIASATNNQPRFDYDPVALVCNGLLIEESRTNLLTYSDDFSNGAWVKNAATISANSAVSPDGTSNADKLVENTDSAEHFVYQLSNGNTKTFSVYAKSAGRNWICVWSATGSTFFNLSNGTLGTVGSGSVATITPAANGYYRCTVYNTNNTYQLVCLATDNNSTVYAGDGVSGVYLWGTQLEAGAFATSYIPTTTTALTRNADVATMTGTNFSSWYNQAQGAFEVEYSQYATGGTVLNASDGTSSNFINIFTSGANQKASCNVFVSGVNNGRLDSGGTFVANSNGKAVYSLIANNRALAYGGNAPSTSASPASMPVVDRLYIGSAYDGASGYNNGYIRKLAYYKQHIINAETQAFSK